MKWANLLAHLDGRVLFETSALLAGPESPGEVRRQLSRWVASGRLIQLRRGLYVVAPPYSTDAPSLFSVASRIRVPSCISLQSALSYHGVIPESTPVVTSVTTGRPGRFDTPLGTFLYRHLKRELFWGYLEVNVEAGQKAFVATAEKALLDLYYLTPGVIQPAFVHELRLDADSLDVERLRAIAARASKPKLSRAADLTIRILEEVRTGERRL
jgi:predicted transcriptional regulator of viral defense system